jgi:hypothetical protein
MDSPGMAVRKTRAAALALSLGLWMGADGSVDAAGEAWSSISPEGASITALAVDPLFPTTLYAGTKETGMLKSTDAGGSWIAANNGLPGPRVFAVAVDPHVSTTSLVRSLC